MTLRFEAAIKVADFCYEAAFNVRDEIVVLFGHSGAGKSLTLRMIAGLLRPDSGHIAISSKGVFDAESGLDLPPQERGVGYVVQDLALFPHMTVAENIAFGIPATLDGPARTKELVALLKLDGLERRKPSELSGGQQQRVALARALGRGAKLLLLDEPFSALDESLRSTLRSELLRLRTELGLSVLFVTHDLREAHLLADRLAVFDDGKLLQIAAPEEVFRRPASRRVAELTGVANILRGAVRRVGGAWLVVRVAGLDLTCVAPPDPVLKDGAAVDVCVRAERVNLRRGMPEEGTENHLRATIVEEFSYGSGHTLRLNPIGPGPALEVEIAARPYEVLNIAEQKEWTVEIPATDIHVIPAAETSPSP